MSSVGRVIVHSLLAATAVSTVTICLALLSMIAALYGFKSKQLRSSGLLWRGSQARMLQLSVANPVAYAAVWRIAAAQG